MVIGILGTVYYIRIARHLFKNYSLHYSRDTLLKTPTIQCALKKIINNNKTYLKYNLYYSLQY